MMKTRVKSPTFIKVRPEMTNTQTTANDATHINRIAWLLLCRNTRMCHLKGWRWCVFALNMQPLSYRMFSLTSRPPCCLCLKDICPSSPNEIICYRFVLLFECLSTFPFIDLFSHICFFNLFLFSMTSYSIVISRY